MYSHWNITVLYPSSGSVPLTASDLWLNSNTLRVWSVIVTRTWEATPRLMNKFQQTEENVNRNLQTKGKSKEQLLKRVAPFTECVLICFRKKGRHKWLPQYSCFMTFLCLTWHTKCCISTWRWIRKTYFSFLLYEREHSSTQSIGGKSLTTFADLEEHEPKWLLLL